MLITYRKKSGEVVDNSGTNSLYPWGPSDEDGYANTDAAGIPRCDLAQLRLHDADNAELVADILRCGCRVKNEQVQLLAEPQGPPPPTAANGAIEYGKVDAAGPPILVTLSSTGDQIKAGRLAGYTPEVSHMVKLTRISGQWVVEDRVLLPNA